MASPRVGVHAVNGARVQLTLCTVTDVGGARFCGDTARRSFTTVHASPAAAFEALRRDYTDVDFGPSDDDLVFLEQLDERRDVTVQMEVVTVSLADLSTEPLGKQWLQHGQWPDPRYSSGTYASGVWSLGIDPARDGAPRWHLTLTRDGEQRFSGYFVTELGGKRFAEQFDAGVKPAVMTIGYEEA